MSFIEAYNWITSLANMPRKEYMTDPRECEWYLKRFQNFLDLIGNPEKKVPHYIHITGTSGKGSTTTFIHTILTTAGITVGSTYSPHPTKITERWKIGNRYMTEEEFVSIIEYLKPKLDDYIRTTKYDMLSFYEITDAIGFLFFLKHKVTHAVVEVGCGGRYDSTNVIPYKDVAIITNIGLDHVGIIGNNKAEIAYEKAGIITKYTHQVITGEKNPRLAHTIEIEAEKNNVPYSRFHTPTYSHVLVTKQGTSFVYQGKKYLISIYGEHQIHNAILAIEAMQKLGIKLEMIQTGLKNTTQPLRMEIVHHRPLVILDGAHNEDKIKSTVATTKILQTVYKIKNVRLIIGFSGDKDITHMLQHLLTLTPASIAVTRNTTNPFRKVADMRYIRSLVKKHLPSCTVELFLDPEDAYRYTIRNSKTSDCVLATGSIFMTGELRGKLLG